MTFIAFLQQILKEEEEKDVYSLEDNDDDSGCNSLCSRDDWFDLTFVFKIEIFGGC